MSLLKKIKRYSAQQPSYSDTEELKSRSLSTKKLVLPGVCVAIAGVLLGTYAGTHVLAKTGQEAVATQGSSTIDPDAIQAVKNMGAYLRTLKSFQVIDASSHDDVLDDGMIVQTNSQINLLAARPDRLRVDVTTDDMHRLYLYDGKQFTVWAELVNYYVIVPAPPSIAELFKMAGEKYNIDLPMYDLFNWGMDEDNIKKIKTAVDVGPSAVDNITCEHYAFHQDGVDWQIWIQLGQFPLPRRLVITTLTDDARPRHSDTLTWNLAPSFNEGAFVFDPPPDAKRIAIAEDKSEAAGTGN